MTFKMEWPSLLFLNYSIDQLKQSKHTDFSQVFQTLKNELPKHYTKEKSNATNPSLDEIFQQFSKLSEIGQKNFLFEDYQNSLNQFQIFLKRTFPNLSGIEEDFYDTLYKLFAVIIGDRLGGFALHVKNQKSKDEGLDKIINSLENGV